LLSSGQGSTHNAFYVEKDITSWYQDGSLWDRIAGRNGYELFEGIYPGCYFNMNNIIKTNTLTAGTASGTKKLLILGCDCRYGIGGSIGDDATYINFHHIICCPETSFGNDQMEINTEDNGLVSGYYNSYMNQQVLGPITNVADIGGTINQQLYNEFGEHLKTCKDTFSHGLEPTILNRRGLTTNDGYGVSTSWHWEFYQSRLMSEIEICGSIIYSGSGNDIASCNKQFPAFRLNIQDIEKRGNYYWSSTIGSYNGYVRFGGNGNTYIQTSTDKSGVRPCFVLS